MKWTTVTCFASYNRSENSILELFFPVDYGKPLSLVLSILRGLKFNRWVTVMLVTSLGWWLYDGDWFEMLVAESLCWPLFSLCFPMYLIGHFFSITNILNRSTTSQTCHKYIWSPTSVNNIEVNSGTKLHLRTKTMWFWTPSNIFLNKKIIPRVIA